MENSCRWVVYVVLVVGLLCLDPARSSGSVTTSSTWETPFVISAGTNQQGLDARDAMSSWVWALRDSVTTEATGNPAGVGDLNGDHISDFACNITLGPQGASRPGIVIVFGAVRDTIGGKSYTLIPAGKRDTEFVVELYQRCPVPGFDLARVEIIYSPHLEQAFENRVAQLQARVGNPAFAPGYEAEGNRATRAAVRERLMEMARRTPEAAYPNVKVVAMWHGTRAEALESVFRAGFASLATTDEGFFGKGVYSAYEARYASEVYSRGALLVNWVSLFSAFPVVDGDMARLTGKGSYANYDAHFIPVRPASAAAGEQNYVACTELSQAVFHELVTFEASQNLPRYLVTLQPSIVQMVPALSSSHVEMLSRETGPKPLQLHSGTASSVTTE
eukprot:m51a1_g8909 hypothetical protein (390) ;mRNA; f:767989-772443